MGILELHNTETQVVIPQPGDLEAAFGMAVLKALDRDNKKILGMILDLRERSAKIMDDLADLVHELSAAEPKGKVVDRKKSLKAARGK